MEHLPLELHEQIFAYLLAPRRDWTNILAAPLSARTERADIYNLRLTCRRIKRAATQPFVQIVGDIPTKCTRECFRTLMNLIELDDVNKNITFLTFDTCKLLIIEKQTLSQLNIKCMRQQGWTTRELHDEACSIFQKIPRLRHMIYFLEAMRGSKTLGFTTGQMVALEVYVGNIPDPTHVSYFVHTADHYLTYSIVHPRCTQVIRNE